MVEEEEATSSRAVIIFVLFCFLISLTSTTSYPHALLLYYTSILLHHPDPIIPTSTPPPLLCCQPATATTSSAANTSAHLCPRALPPQPPQQPTDRHAPIAFLTSPPRPLSSCKQASRYRTQSPHQPQPSAATQSSAWLASLRRLLAASKSGLIHVPPSLYPAVDSTLPPSSSKQLVQPPAIARLQLLCPLLLPTASVALAAAPGVRALHYSPRQTEPDTSCAAAPLPPNRRLYSSR